MCNIIWLQSALLKNHLQEVTDAFVQTDIMHNSSLPVCRVRGDLKWSNVPKEPNPLRPNIVKQVFGKN